jgi:phage pi2 protein 07
MIKGLVNKSKKAIQDDLRKEFILESKNELFVKLCNRLKMSEEELMKYTSKLETTTCELDNCSKCKGLDKCKNEINGHVFYPKKVGDHLEFEYKPCKYFKEIKVDNHTTFFDTPKVLEKANLSD